MPDPTPPTNKAQPSASTVGSAVGGMLAVFLFLGLKAFGVEVDPVSASVISGGMAALAGYFFTGGRTVDTE